MKKRIVIGSLTIAAAAMGTIFGLALFKNGKGAVARYKLEPITRRDIEAVVMASGTVNAITSVEVGSQVSGRIARMHVDYNSRVKRGQVLAELDALPFRTRVAQSQANYLSDVASLDKARVTAANLKSKYERSLSLAEKNLVSPDELESARAGYLEAKTEVQRAEASVEQAKSELDSSRLDLGYTIIPSPIDGIVISRNMEVGQTVQASFQAIKMFVIANDLGRMRVECDVDEADVGRVREGQKVRFTVGAFPEDVFRGVVNQVRYSPTTSSSVVTYTTIVDVDNPELKLRPGMTAAVTIVTGEAKGALCVPAAALRFTPDLAAEEIASMRESAAKLSAGSGAAGQTAANGAVAIDPAAAKMPAQRRALVWLVDEKGTLRAAAVGAGIGNTSFVEVLAGELKEGQKVITGYETAEAAAARAQNPGPPPGAMMMGAPPPPPPPPPR